MIKDRKELTRDQLLFIERYRYECHTFDDVARRLGLDSFREEGDL